MDTYEFKPTEDFTLAKATQGGDEAQALAGATFEPAAFVEGTGEVQPAEALQVTFEVMIASVPLETPEESIPPESSHASPEELVTRPPGEVIVEGGLPMGAAPEGETTGESEPVESDDAKEWGATSTPTVRVEAAVPTDLPQEGVVIPPTLPGREEGRAIPEAKGVGEAPLPGTGRVEYEEQPERLDARLPEAQEPLAGLEAKEFTGVAPGKGSGRPSDVSEFDGRVGDASDSELPGVPFDLPDIDEMAGTGAGKEGGPRVVGNMPMGGGMHGSDSSIPDFGFPDMPTSGGYSSSGSGPAIIGGAGGYSTGGWFDEMFGAAEDAIKRDKDVPTYDTYVREAKNVRECDGYAAKIQHLLALKKGSERGESKAALTCETPYNDVYYEIWADNFTREIKKKSQEPDDSNPTPYLGGSMGPATPEKDNDTGKVLPDADLDGFDLPVWSADPDSVDDSGRFYGGIFGGDKVYPDSGGARPIDPVRKTEDEAETADDAG